jgi:hypothetical protein
METTPRRTVTTIALASLLGLALASGSALAGRGVGGDNGNKTGTYNMKQSYECPDGYYYQYWGYGHPADINNNYVVCYKYTGQADDASYIDDTSWKWD